MEKGRKNILYIFINIMVIFISMLAVMFRMQVFDEVTFYYNGMGIVLGIVFILAFLFVHLSKMLRYYIILLEEKMEFSRFVKVYIKITFANMALPLKMGEVFRVYCFSKETRNLKIAFFSAVIDRFFDICALLVILLPYDLIVRRDISVVTALLIIFIVVTMIVYKVFMPTYTYLNKFLITSTKSKNAIVILHILENTRTWYEYISKLLTGRSSLVFAFSCLGWVFEFGALKCITSLIGEAFKISNFVNYIESIFGIGSGRLLNVYTTISCLVLFLVTVIVYALAYVRKGEGWSAKKGSYNI